MIQPKFELLPKETQLKIITEAGQQGIGVIAKQYHASVDMTERSLYNAIKKRIAPRKEIENTPRNGGRKPISERELSRKEKELLKRISNGEVSLEEATRVVAVRVFENMLKNPQDAKFIDFFRAEWLKLKQEENKIKDTWGKEIIARFFAGKLPPKFCPHCGKATVDSVVLEGEVASDRLIESSDDN